MLNYFPLCILNLHTYIIFAYQSSWVAFIHFSNALMMLGRHCKAPHIGVNVYRLHQTVDGAFHIYLLVAIRSVHVASACIMAAASSSMEGGRLTEAFTGFTPVLRHFKHIASSLIALDSIFNFIGATAIIYNRNYECKQCISPAHIFTHT